MTRGPGVSAGAAACRERAGRAGPRALRPPAPATCAGHLRVTAPQVGSVRLQVLPLGVLPPINTARDTEPP